MGVIQLKTQIPGPKSLALMEKRKALVARGPFHVTSLFPKKASGAVIEDVDGNRFIDFASGIGVTNVGHSPEKVVAAITQQARNYLHTAFNVLPYESYLQVAEKLNKAMPGNFPKKTFLANSGAEAGENAVKIARAYTGRSAVICFDHAFHGRTYLAMAMTSKYKPYKYGFGPYPSDVYRAPFPYAYRWPTSQDPEQVSKECFAQFVELVQNRLTPTHVAAVMIEPVLGEGGFVPVPATYFKLLREYCTTHDIVLIVDEIQSGFGRTGTLFACEQLGIEPDLLVTAKGLAAGMPLSAVTGKAEIMDAPIEGGIGGTFGGNPVACAASLAVFDLFEKTNILSNVKMITQELTTSFEKWFTQFECIGNTRGLGAMQGIELVKNRKTKEPDPETTKKIVQFCIKNGVILMSAGTYGNVLRFLMPLTISQAELQEGLAVVEKAFESI